jgi:acetyl esterase
MKPPRIFLRATLALVAGFALLAAPLHAQAAKAAKKNAAADKPAPTLANVKYGPHERHVLDLWQAKSAQPASLVVFIHGGGFRGGSKENISAGLLEGLLARGISVMSINYRLSPEVSYPAHYMDSARAIQFARSKAKDWNLDPTRFAASGSSAGAGTSLWIGFHDEMADPKNADPVLRQSTRLTCMAVTGAQSSYNPKMIKEWVGESAAAHPALPGIVGVEPEEIYSPRAQELFEGASAINYLTRDDPPVYAYYAEARVLPANAKAGAGIHHINLGLRLKEKMDALGIECVVRHRDEGANADREMVEFLSRHLGRKNAATKGTQ